jgi:hypothetical protein
MPTTCSHLVFWRSDAITASASRSTKPSSHFSIPHQQLVYIFFSLVRATSPAHLIILDFINLIIGHGKYKPWNSSLRCVIQSPVTFNHVDPNIFCSTLFSNNFSTWCSLNMTDQVLHPYEKTRKVIFMYILDVLRFFCILNGKKSDFEECVGNHFEKSKCWFKIS